MTDRRLLFWCPDVVNPSGGMWVVYRHVDILNESGLESVVVHNEPGFRYPWYGSRTPVVSIADLDRRPGDVVVALDVVADVIGLIDQSIPIVVFSQNSYLTPWERRDNRTRSDNPYRAPNVRAIVTTNADNHRYLARAFPHLDVRRLHLSVSPLMSPARARKEPLVSYMPRKNPDHAEAVVGRLRDSGALEGVEVEAVHGRPHEEVADILARSSVFLSFGFPEGWALPPAEAMASGCVVVGYHGLGGSEYWAPDCTFPIGFGDTETFVSTAGRILTRLRTDPEGLHQLGRDAARSIRRNYPAGREHRSVVDTWKWVLARTEGDHPVRTAAGM